MYVTTSSKILSRLRARENFRKVIDPDRAIDIIPGKAVDRTRMAQALDPPGYMENSP
jgi:hypothetical protein